MAPAITYVVPRFPKLSETFILYEILELERRGLEVDVVALRREPLDVAHPEAVRRAPSVLYALHEPRRLLAAQWHWLRRRPGTYLGTWARALWGLRSSPTFLARALGAVPAGALAGQMADARGATRIHAQYATHSALAGWAAARLTGRPFSFTAHAHDIYVDTTMLCEKVAAADLVVTISEYNRRLLRELCGPAALRVEVVRTGADLATHRVAAPPGDDVPFSICCVASLEAYKGQRWLIDALALLRGEGLDVRCVFAGAGGDRAALEAHARDRGVDDLCVLGGGLPKPAIRELLVGSHAMVLPSVVTETGKREGIPVALMEALATGRPVVATDISGISELVTDGETGLLVAQRDARALADAIRRLHDDPPLAARLAAAGRARVEAEYDLAANAARLAALLAG